ncbi:MAG: hypothetical protein VYD57_11380 [Pseudomonadota bacterium]|nr:hypothetical protein [Pseudomonadota bacterium]
MTGLAKRRENFVADDHSLPRAYLRDPFDLDDEVEETLKRTQDLAPPGKRIALYQWSGDAMAFEAAIAATRKAGVRNINGGDIRFDDQEPSVGYVAPIARTVGAERQIYAVNTNENVFTDLWTDRFNGFRQLRETFDRTGSPRRLRGVNLYYHTYSAERAASLDAIKAHLEWMRKQELIAIRASDYASIADGFFSTRIDEIGHIRWRIGERGGLQTVRFDGADYLDADLSESVGVIGTSRFDGSLYVALDPTVVEVVVALGAIRKGNPTDLSQANLARSSWSISHLVRAPSLVTFNASGFAEGRIEFESVPSGHYRMRADGPEGETIWADLVVEGDGRLVLDVPLDARTRALRVAIESLSSGTTKKESRS